MSYEFKPIVETLKDPPEAQPLNKNNYVSILKRTNQEENLLQSKTLLHFSPEKFGGKIGKLFEKNDRKRKEGEAGS